MSKKRQNGTVILVTANKRAASKEFPLSQAEEILNMKFSGWELKDPKYTFKNGNITRSASTGDIQDASESKGN
jgi:hypothetical protein